MTLHFLLLISRQGKVRLSKWYSPYNQKDRTRIVKEVCSLLIGRPSKLCNFLDWRDQKIIYKRYASLYFVTCADKDDNELMVLEMIHHYVEVLDRYFGNVCELDLVFNFHKAYAVLDEIILGGELQETSKKAVLRAVSAQDALFETTGDYRLEI